jgi:miniconductance mechanosensitive channel
MHEHLIPWLQGLGLTASVSRAIAVTAGVLAIALLACLANLAAKHLLLRSIRLLAARTETKWDDIFVERNVFGRLSHLAPALVIYWLTPLLFPSSPALIGATQRMVAIYMILVGLLAIDALLNAASDIYSTYDTSKHIPLRGFVQVVKVVLYCIGAVVVLAIVLDKTPLYLLSGLGALTAVLLIVFKDPILGFVGGIQLSANKMVAIGDWIEMPSHNADGDVIEVALTTVKVRNWDKTITTIPTYDLITSSFKNWRGMQESGGRRMKRSVNIDINTIRFCDEEMLARFSKIQFIREYIDRKRAEVVEYNEEHEVDDSSLVNGRRMTNVGTFRAYVVAYLRNHPSIHSELTFLVRQLAPGPGGLPIEIYVFINNTEWVGYEAVQSDIFDHILAVVPQFDLRVFQNPTGVDFRAGLQTPRRPARLT